MKQEVMKTFKLLSFFMLLAVLVSCGSRVRTTRPTDVDLNKYRTFAYLPNANPDVEGKAYNDANINKAIIETINANMEQAGYTLDRNNPDLLVLVSTKTYMQTNVSTDPVYATYPYTVGVNSVYPYYNFYYYTDFAGYNGIIGYDTDTYNYKEGILIINLVDKKTKRVVWKGIAAAPVYSETSMMAIQEMVNDNFKK